MAKKHYDQSNSSTIDSRHWRIYVFKEFGEMFELRKDMFVLYQTEVSYFLVRGLHIFLIMLPAPVSQMTVKLL